MQRVDRQRLAFFGELAPRVGARVLRDQFERRARIAGEEFLGSTE